MSISLENDQRRGARLHGNFWVWVLSEDTGPRLRRGNISISGTLLETVCELGGPGHVTGLRLGRTPEDFAQQKTVDVMARVVRETTATGRHTGMRTNAVAFEYLIDDRSGREAVEEFVRSAAQSRLIQKNDLDVACRLPARFETVPGGSEHPGCSVTRMGTESIVFVAPAAANAGDRLNLFVRAPCTLDESRLDVVVVDCHTVSDSELTTPNVIRARYAPARVSLPGNGDVEIASEAGSTMHNALAILDEAMVPSEPCEPLALPQLKGDLSVINLFSLLAFLELECRSGVLRLEGPDEEWGFIYLREGHILDVERGKTSDGDVWSRLSAVLGWQQGTFSMVFQEISRDDLFGQPTTAVLMDAARRCDEAAADDDEMDLDLGGDEPF